MGLQGVIAVLWILFTPASLGSAGIPLDAANCNLQSPPPGAGELMGDEPEFDLKVFPRRKNLPHGYTGCQTTWYKVAGHWTHFSIAYFERGKAVVLFSAERSADEGASLLCRYRRKKIVSGNEDDCPLPDEVLLPSMPEGCIKRLRPHEQRVPTACEYDEPAR